MNYSEALSEFNIKQGISLNELTRAYKKLAKTRHPDTGGSTQSFQRLYQAYKILGSTNIRIDEMIKPKPSPRAQKATVSEQFVGDRFKQATNLKIKMMFFFCYIFNIKVFTYCGYHFIEFKDKLIIPSIMPKEENVIFKLKTYSKILKPQLGLNQLENKLYILFF